MEDWFKSFLRIIYALNGLWGFCDTGDGKAASLRSRALKDNEACMVNLSNEGPEENGFKSFI